MEGASNGLSWVLIEIQGGRDTEYVRMDYSLDVIQDALWLLLCGVLHTRGSPGQHAIRQWYQTRRADNSM